MSRSPAVYSAEEVAELLGVSDWSVYQAARHHEAPIGTLALKVGRRVVFPRVPIDRLLGRENDVRESRADPARTT